MNRGPILLGLALLLAACGSRTGLEPGDGSPLDEPSAGLVPFPTIEESTALPEPDAAPARRERQYGFAEDGSECGLAVPSLDAVLARIQADVQAQPASDRPFLRYVSAAVLVPGFCRVDSAVNLVADALALLLNSLSLTMNAARARPLDGAEALLRFDLREMGWDRPIRIGELEHTDAWEALSANAALSVALRGPEADALLEQIGTRTPLLHAHDFARAALGAGAYYALLDAPATLAELRSALGIPPELEAEPNAYWRAITTNSRISRQDRVLLRYRAAADAPLFWHTLDRGPAASATALADPLGRERDESSVVYTLPNGLPAYFLADADGRRLDESRVLIDTNEGDFVPRTAPSCMRCHGDVGVMPVTDELRAYAATDPNGRFSARDLALLAEVYPPQEQLDALIEADRRRVANAQARLGVPGPGIGVRALDELVLILPRPLEPARAAAELFVGAAELASRRAELPGTLRVLTSLGSVSRASFDDGYLAALCVLLRDARNQPVDCP